ncbi:hypothetical protein FZEAL_9504 [Fusarium zealandicum]|uniref:Uncharacterized protein n=1 Tax=Fusarium zealandicum TaxID=1053134 RepID=A0A8H4XF54_9HYPO|nr:hypothetical protein FZEAL_9504 [Fusarium zealandicum]
MTDRPIENRPDASSTPVLSPAPAPAPAPSSPAPQAELVPAQDFQHDETDADSALGSEDTDSSTFSITNSVVAYRTIQGRTFHSDRHPTEYFTPNDDQQLHSIDITHHSLLLLLDNNLYLAPVGSDFQVRLTNPPMYAVHLADLAPP